MTCRDVIDFLLSYVQGELPESERAIFERHLAECPPCVNYLQSYRATVNLEKTSFTSSEDHPCTEIPEQLIQAILLARRKN